MEGEEKGKKELRRKHTSGEKWRVCKWKKLSSVRNTHVLCDGRTNKGVSSSPFPLNIFPSLPIFPFRLQTATLGYSQHHFLTLPAASPTDNGHYTAIHQNATFSFTVCPLNKHPLPSPLPNTCCLLPLPLLFLLLSRPCTLYCLLLLT